MKQGLKVFYDEEQDILYIAKEGKEEEFVDVQPGINIELDGNREVVGVEIIKASEVLKEVIEPMRRKIRV